MIMHAQPIHALVPWVGPFVGDVPEDRHAERVVQMMLDFFGGADEAGSSRSSTRRWERGSGAR